MSSIILPRRRIWQPDTPAALAPAWAGARVVVTPGYLAAAGAPLTTESVGRAWNFNGSNQFVDLGASPASFSTMTVGLLLRVDTSSTFGLPIASSNGLNSAGFDFIADADLNPFRIYPRIRNASTRYSVTTTYTSVRGAWEMHVATLYDGTLRHYVNGREYGSVAAPGSFAPTQNLMLARRGTTYFPCRVALAFEYPFAWSADQIRQHAENPWQMFAPLRRRVFSFASAPGAVTGTLSANESGTDAASIAGKVLVRGALSAAEVGADTGSASGVVRVSGAASAAETGTDTAAAAGKVIVSGALASAEAGSDSAAASGTVRVAGTLAATESAADTFAAAGSVAISGALASTEVGSDSSAASGKVIVAGTASAAEAEHDQAAAAGAVLVSGALSGTETGTDYAVIVGGAVMPPATGVLAATEAGIDTAVLAGVLLVSGAAAASEAAADVAAVAGTVLVRGEVAAVEAGADAVAATGHVPVSGALLATESGTDFALINGSSVVITVGVLLASETGTDTAAIGGAVRIGGTFAAFEDAADIAVLDGAVLVSGSLDAAETGQDTAVIGSPPRDMTPRKGFIAGAALNRRYLTGASTSRRFSA